MRFGKLVIVGGPIGTIVAKHRWETTCDCGKTRLCRRYDLLRTDRRSVKCCGCTRGESHIVHGFASRALKQTGYTPEYRGWMAMRARCNNPKTENFRYYGGRGIKVCARWEKFENFLADMGPKPDDQYTLERKDHDGNYTPKNCVWIHRSQQAKNTRRATTLAIGDETKSLTEWSQISGRPTTTIVQRLKRGWSAKRAVFEKARW